MPRRPSDLLLTHSAPNGRFGGPKQKGMDPQIHASQTLPKIAGDRIRAGDVQPRRIARRCIGRQHRQRDRQRHGRLISPHKEADKPPVIMNPLLRIPLRR